MLCVACLYYIKKITKTDICIILSQHVLAYNERVVKEGSRSVYYGDLMLFHLVIGAMYLAKEEMTYEGKNVSVVRKLLKQYGSDPFVRKTLTIRNCLHYAVQIKSVFWKLLSFTLVLFLRIHAYGFLSAILVFMSRLGIDSL